MRVPHVIRLGGTASSLLFLLTGSWDAQPNPPIPWPPGPPLATRVVQALTATPQPVPPTPTPEPMELLTPTPEPMELPTPTPRPQEAPDEVTPQPVPPTPSQVPSAQPRPRPDAWEPNNSRTEAREISIGETISDLTFVCPDESGCADNDFFRLPIKGGTCYQIETIDLAPGLDTNIIVYGPDSEEALAGNDDIAPDELRSGLDVCIPVSWQPTSLLILIGNVGNVSPPTPAEERTYALQVELTEPPRPSTPAVPSEPASLPAPAANPAPPTNPAPPANPAPPQSPPTPSATAAPAGSGAPSESGVAATSRASRITDAPTGPALVRVQETTLRVGPGTRTEAIVPLPNGTGVLLLGTSEGAWAYVQPVVSVIPGWVYAPDLTPMDGTIAGADAFRETEAVSQTAVVSDTTVLTPVPSPSAAASDAAAADLAVEPLPDVVDPVAAPLPRKSLEITVEVVAAPDTATGNAPSTESTPLPEQFLSGVKVQLVTAFGDVLVDINSVAHEPLRFTPDVPTGTALFVQAPALAIREAVIFKAEDNGRALVRIEVPRIGGVE